MTTYFHDLATSFVAYSIIACAYFAWGKIGARAMRLSFTSYERPFSLIWIGWSVSLLFFHLCNFVVPVSICVSGAFFGFGFVLWLLAWREHYAICKGAKWSHLAYVALVAGFAVWAASRGMLPPTHYDSGFYHFNSIRWLNEYPIIPGLGNLHGRLAFNQSFFTYVASLNLYPLFNHGANLANGFLLLLLTAQCLFCLFSFLASNRQKTEEWSLYRAVPILLLPLIFLVATTALWLNNIYTWSTVSSPTPDIASTLLQILLFIHFASFLHEHRVAGRQDSHLDMILLLSATAITIKLSNIFYAATISAIALILDLGLFKTGCRLLLCRIFKVCALPCLIMLVWMARGLILSGCPAYPSTFGRIQTDWSVPVADVTYMANAIYSWARLPGAVAGEPLSFWGWLLPWLYSLEHSVVIRYALCLSCINILILLFFFIFSGKKLKEKKSDRLVILLPVPVVVGLLLWCLTVPDMRFAYALFGILPVATMIPAFSFSERPAGMSICRMVLAIFVAVNVSIGSWFWDNTWLITRISTEGYKPIPVIPVVAKKTTSGLTVWIPKNGEQCWNAQLPCTPYFNPDLKLRKEDIRSGFTVTGQKR
jgi:hypothetical protein